MFRILKIPFLKHPCEGGRCITSMICHEDMSCKIFAEHSNKCDKLFSKYDYDSFRDVPFYIKPIACLFIFMMVCKYPKRAWTDMSTWYKDKFG